MRRAIADEAIGRSGKAQRRAELMRVVARSVDAGALLFEALTAIGIAGDVILAAAASVTGLSPAPRLLVKNPQIPDGIDPVGVRDAGGVPIGTVQGRAWIAFADPEAAKAAVFSDDVVVCLALPDDLHAARATFDAAFPPDDDGATLTMAAVTPESLKAHREAKARAASKAARWEDATAPEAVVVVKRPLPSPGGRAENEEDLFDGPSATAMANAMTRAKTKPADPAKFGGPTTGPGVDPSASTRVAQNPLRADLLGHSGAPHGDAEASSRRSGPLRADVDVGDPGSDEKLRLLKLAQLGRLKRFQFVRPLGSGAMATVYLATDRASGRAVAVKVLDPRLVDEPLAVARFARELHALRSLDHPHVTSTIDGGDTASDGVCWLACPHLDGGTLAALVTRTGAMPLALALPIFGALLEGVGHAHLRGVLHRDLKPQNVLLSMAGDVQVADFGLARVAGDTPLTSAGVRFGTPAYMAPEQARGDVVDERADLFALGVMAVELFTGRHPFARDTPQQTLAAVARGAVPRLSTLVQVPAVVDDVVAGLCMRDRDQRFGSAVDAHLLLAHLLEGLPAVEAVVAHALKQPAIVRAEPPSDLASEGEAVTTGDDGMGRPLPPTFVDPRSIETPRPVIAPPADGVIDPTLTTETELARPKAAPTAPDVAPLSLLVDPPVDDVVAPVVAPIAAAVDDDIELDRPPFRRGAAIAIGIGAALALLLALVIASFVL
ncbi:MAG: serine/threonine-protein kinase [Deltaproteobacteria bacterium]|nr:serine/threonine-protein kinase [Deltaproteobacteria bacterium]